MKFLPIDCRNYFALDDIINATYEEKGLWIEALLFCAKYDLDAVILDYRLALDTDCFVRMKKHGECGLWSFDGEYTIIVHYFNHDAYQRYLSLHYRLNGDYKIIKSFYKHLDTVKMNNNRVMPQGRHSATRVRNKVDKGVSRKKGVAYALKKSRANKKGH